LDNLDEKDFRRSLPRFTGDGYKKAGLHALCMSEALTLLYGTVEASCVQYVPIARALRDRE